MALAPNVPKIVNDVRAGAALLYTDTRRFPEFTQQALAGRFSRVRGRRSSLREAVALVMDALAARWDRRTDRCGAPRGDRNDSADCPTVAELARDTGLSLSRTKRALRELEWAGYIKSHRAVMAYSDGNRFCGLPSVRVLQAKFFQRLRIRELKLARAKNHAAARWRQLREKPVSPVGVRQLRRELRRARPGSTFTPGPPAPPTPQLDPAERLERLAKLFGIPPTRE